jgi:hypothetical protein
MYGGPKYIVVWVELLGMTAIGVQDNFFNLAITFVGKIANRGDADLTLQWKERTKGAYAAALTGILKDCYPAI